MAEAAKTFLDCETPVRTARNARYIVGTFCVSLLGFGVFVILAVSSPDDPTSERLGIATGGILVGIVAFVVGCSLLWRYLKGGVDQIRISDAGIAYHGKEWAWTAVVSIKTARMPNRLAALSISLRTDYGPLTLPIEYDANENPMLIEELEEYLDSKEYGIRWE